MKLPPRLLKALNLQDVTLFAVDPSTKGGHWVLALAAPFQVAASGEMASREEIEPTLRAHLRPELAVVVETLDDWPPVSNGLSLLQTAVTAGLVAGVAQGMGLPVALVPSKAWRQHLFGKQAGDAEVRLFVEGSIARHSGLKRWNQHSRDAAALAYAAWDAARWAGRPGEGRVVKLPRRF